MIEGIQKRIERMATAAGLHPFFGFIPEITKAIDSESRRGNEAFPAVFVCKDITTDGHRATIDCLIVDTIRKPQGVNGVEEMYTYACDFVDFCGGYSYRTRFNIIADASLAFTQTFKNINLQPLTLNNLRGLEFQMTIFC